MHGPSSNLALETLAHAAEALVQWGLAGTRRGSRHACRAGANTSYEAQTLESNVR
jgi:hypothetical protein